LTEPDALELADRLFAAITAGDVEALREIYAPDARVWHAHDGVAQSVDENLRVLAWVVKHLTGLRYEEVRRQRTDTGFVQQHVLRGTGPDGAPFALPACLVCCVARGRITRIDEYLDSRGLEPLLRAAR
jgi:ketosteroid isomerase-like protein